MKRLFSARVMPRETILSAIAMFDERCAARNLSPHTFRFYHNRFAAFLTWMDAHHPEVALDGITPAILRAFFAHETQRVSPITAEDSYVTLRAFFRFLTTEGEVEANPMEKVERIRQPRKIIATYSTEQVAALLATCERDFMGKRDTAILYLLTDCGLRVSELCGLTVTDIDWAQQTLLIHGKGSKDRAVPFGSTAAKALRAYLAHRGELRTDGVFVTCYGTPLSRRRVLGMLKARASKAEVPAELATCHNFRRYFACAFIRNNGDVFTLQRILGHSSLEMSRRYAELSQVDVIAKHRQCSPGDALRVQATTGRQRMK